MAKQPVHTVEYLDKTNVVTRHKEPACIITFDKANNLLDFFSSEDLSIEKRLTYINKARAYLRSPLAKS